MRIDEVYTVRELLQLNEEKAQKNEFKPKFGNGAKRGGSDNEKAVKDILKQAQAYDEKGRTGRAKRNKPEVEFPDYNKTTMDVKFEYEPSKEWKERNKKLMTVGTESDMADYYDNEGNKSFYDNRKNASKERNDRDKTEREKGLVGRELKSKKDYSNITGFINEQNAYTSGEITPKVSQANRRCQFTHGKANDEVDNDEVITMDDGLEKSHEGRHTVTENAITKRLKFKNTIFLDESHVLSKVPEEYKIDENRFYMQDKTGSDYIVECKADQFGCVHMSVEKKLEKKQVNEELDKMRRLAGYKYSDDNVKMSKPSDMSESISNFRQLLNK